MPTSPLQQCSVQGCGTLVPYGRCEMHRLEARTESWRRADANRPSAARRGYDHTWRAFRADYLTAHPYCESAACSSLPVWRRTVATDVDHLDGLGPLGPRGYDVSNLQALCHPCHSAKTNAVDGGFGRRPA